ncbi:carbohydrate ABC transporter permease [Paenibacillus azoreducens]|uniref:carbohydrate ABC transporter permease n=1 Tax=Paenibacillus azoreducens TaxID=116718 RepID=UPI001F2A04D8|nr:carbohydrate ABC transporter permease [Paenibacillus azoreducens]
MTILSGSMVKGRRVDWGGVILYLFLSCFAILMVAPLVYLVSTAFKPLEELFLFPPRFFVINPTLKNFNDLLMITSASTVPFSRYIFNSLFITIASVSLGVVISAMAAYPLSKHQMPFRKQIFSMIILALMFAPAVTQIPQYLVITKLGLMNTYWAMIVPGLAAPVFLFLTKQFLDQIPDALLEAAKIDGAREWVIFWRIVMPMLKPALSTVVLLSFISTWNDPGPAMLFTTSESMKTLPYALSTISGGTGVIAQAGAGAAAALLTVIPSIVMFVISQRMVLETMAHSGIKD